MRVARTEEPREDVTTVRFGDEERVVRSSAAMLGVVADLRALLVAIQRAHRRVAVNPEARGSGRALEKNRAELIVCALKFREDHGPALDEEPAERVRPGESREPRDVLEDAVRSE